MATRIVSAELASSDPWQGLDPAACAGVAAVGRGCWFGPVFAAAVVLPAYALAPLAGLGLADGKPLAASRRAAVVPIIKPWAAAWAIGQSSAAEIDRHGIRLATEQAMHRALQKLPHPPELLLVDGVLPLRGWSGEQVCLVRGDIHCLALAAANALAQQARDDLMTGLAQRYPGYGLELHAGYGTPLHRAALAQWAPTPMHRLSFIRQMGPPNRDRAEVI